MQVVENPIIFLENENTENVPDMSNSELNKNGDIYQINNIIESGGFGKVYNCITPNREEVAIKIIDKFKLKGQNNNISDIQNEILIHYELEHINIVKFLGVYQSISKIFILLELCEFDLYTTITNSKNRIEPLEGKSIIKGIANGLLYLHELLIVHRDIKLENILIDKFGNVKIADFGQAHKLKTSDGLLYSIKGTQSYFSPEMLSRTGYSFSTDIWALGILFYVLLFKFFPFRSNSFTDLCGKISKGVVIFPKREDIDIESIDLIKSMLIVDINSRISLQDIIDRI